MSVAYWTFRYWGFSRDRVKILNGGDDAWDVAGRPLTDALLVPTPSTYSVTENKVLKDVLRVVGRRDAGATSTPSTRTAACSTPGSCSRCAASPPRPTSRTPTGRPTPNQFVTDRVNGEAARNRLYPDRTTLVSRMAASPVLDGAAQTFLSPEQEDDRDVLHLHERLADLRPLRRGPRGPRGRHHDVRRLREPVEQLHRGEDPGRGRQRGAGRDLGLRRRHPGDQRPARDRHLPRRRCRARTPSCPATSPTRPRRARRTRSRPPTRPTWPRPRAGARPAAVAAAAPPAAAAEARRHDNDQHSNVRIGLLLALALALLAAPVLAQEENGMTAPPWGDAGARINFGDEDQGALQIQYKGAVPGHLPRHRLGRGRHGRHDQPRLPPQPARLHGRLERQVQPLRPDRVRRAEPRPGRLLRRRLRATTSSSSTRRCGSASATPSR